LAISRERKEELLGIYGDLLGQAGGVIFTEFKGISVKQVNAIRAKLRDVEAAYMVTKNTLFGIALQNAGWPVPEALLNGQTSVIFSAHNYPEVAKATIGLLKDYDGLLSVKGGIMDGLLLNPNQVEAISSLPALPELRAQLAGLIAQPAAGLVGVLNGAVAAVPMVVQAYVSKNEAA
jgi:large subunit ribosomal protein L10